MMSAADPKKIAVIAMVALAGCAAYWAEQKARVCWQGALPHQCDRAFIELRCDQVLPTGKTAAPGSQIAVEVVKGIDAPIVGELFSQFCPPDCIPIQLRGAPPWQTLSDDVAAILKRHGYVIAPPAATGIKVLDLVGVRADVRSDKPGWTDMKVPTRAVVGFSATLQVGENEVWSVHFAGESELASAYASLRDSQQVFSEAYCAALEEFAGLVGDGALDKVAGDERS
jgi:hypothetical protein